MSYLPDPARALANQQLRYDGYDKNIFGPFVDMGFDVSRILATFEYFGIPKNVDQLGPELMEEVTERLLTGA